ncbi:unnamed protein product [Schistocephalus solidus]|uniref:C2H2-type domain-containing protein n=1 Tax=Schistocephalus solidus TaxID=70667 RepID=A0A183SHI0_SCHSO|nr:unnamed protein product [Schistocephalus solidus]
MLRSAVKTGATIYEDAEIAAAKAKGAVREFQPPRINTVNTQELPNYPRCKRTFQASTGLVKHLWTQCSNNLTTSNSTSTNPSTVIPTLNTTPSTVTTSLTTGEHTANTQPPSITGTIFPAANTSSAMTPITTVPASPTLTTATTTSDF